MPGAITFPINQRLLSGGLSVTDRQVADAMSTAFDHLKMVIEPGGAVALAAALSGKLDLKGRTIAVTASGGNVDRATFIKALAD
jgi:threonine dehydratase